MCFVESKVFEHPVRRRILLLIACSLGWLLAAAAIATMPATPAQAAPDVWPALEPEAATTCTSVAGGAWSDAATWSCGHVPADGDAVGIATGHAVVLDIHSARLQSLNITGTLTLGSSSAPVTLTISPLQVTTPAVLRVASGGILQMAPGGAAHSINLTPLDDGRVSWIVDGAFSPGKSTVSLGSFQSAVVIDGQASTQTFYNLSTGMQSTATVQGSTMELAVLGDLALGYQGTFTPPALLDLTGNVTGGLASNGKVIFNGTGDQYVSVTRYDSSVSFTDMIVQPGAVVHLPGVPKVPAVSGVVTNSGTLVQTGPTSPFLTASSFLTWDGHYGGVGIDPAQPYEAHTSVAIAGGQTCPGAPANSVRRCYNIAYTTTQTLTVRFYFSYAELPAGVSLDHLAVLRQDGTRWAPMTRGADSGACVAGDIACYVEGAGINRPGRYTLGYVYRVWLPQISK
jgi:hypothetical protein